MWKQRLLKEYLLAIDQLRMLQRCGKVTLADAQHVIIAREQYYKA